MVALLMIFPILLFVANILYPSGASGDDSSFAGVSKGDSVCQIKDSPCHDETSVYYVSRGADPDNFQMKMNKVVDGKEETMGTVNRRAAADAALYVCRLNDVSTWTWRLSKDVLDGELRYRGQRNRKIHLVRAG
jgi:hypothetical protein